MGHGESWCKSSIPNQIFKDRMTMVGRQKGLSLNIPDDGYSSISYFAVSAKGMKLLVGQV